MKTPSLKKLQWGILSSLFLLVVPSARSQNPVPFIDILSPTSTYPGHGDFTLTIGGANFATGATVQFDGVTLTPSSITRNSLTVTVPAAAVASAHTASITVKDPNTNPSNLIKSNVAFFPITTVKAFLDWTAPLAVLDPPPPFGPNTGPPATAVAVGDFNGDGHQDVVVVLPGTGTIQVYLGDGKLNFTPVPNPPSTGLGAIVALEVGDFNNDGYLDVATTDGITLGIFFNDGKGNLSVGPTTPFPSGGWDASRCATPRFRVADINGDGALDLILPHGGDPEVVVLLGDGQGHFMQSSAVALPPVNDLPQFPACGLEVGDFNNDGWVDLAYGTSRGTMIFAFNDGTGGFSPANTYIMGNGPFGSSAAGDVNGDGFLDLVDANLVSCGAFLCSTFDIVRNQQNGTFTAATVPVPATGNSFTDVVLGDLSGGGALDAFVLLETGPSLFSYFGVPLIGNGSGSFSLNPSLSGASLVPVFAVRLGDFNEDGRLDAVYIGFTAPNVSQNGVAFEYWLQIAGPPIWSVPQKDLGTLILHLGQLSGNQQQVLTETLSNSGPGVLDIATICSNNPGPAQIGTAPTPAGSNPCSTGTGSVNFPISAAASTCPLSGGTPGTNAGTLQPGASCTVAVTFQPTTFGTFSGTLAVVDDANGVPGSVQNVTLTGTAIELDANVQPPINADGTSVFNAQRGVVPVKFTLQQNGAATCQLPPATIGIIRTAGGTIGPIDTAVFEMAADNGANFRIDTNACQYVYNVGARSLGPGTYSVQIFVNPTDLGGKNPGPNGIGSATFGLH